jgi:hypothetical protein
VQARDLLEAMCASRYDEAFGILTQLQPMLALDVYASAALPDLQALIRKRALQQHMQARICSELYCLIQNCTCTLRGL